MSREAALRANSACVRAAAVVLAAAFLLPAGVGAQEEGKPRRGFVLNLGAGPAATRYNHSSFGVSGPSTTNLAVGTDFKIGHAFSDQLLVYYSNDASFFAPEGTGVDLVGSGMSGLGATYFIETRSPSPFVHGSFGIAAWNELAANGVTEAEAGLGISIGGGYEFARHWLLDVDIVYGRPGGRSITTLRTAINWLLY